jgi:hypothetical protein
VAAKPPHHNPLFSGKLGSYKHRYHSSTLKIDWL